MDIKSAITKIDSPCIVMAGAGTGKTNLMVEKVDYLIKNKIFPPEKIVCITFSNEAANNLLSRIRKNTEGTPPIVRTFHAFSAQILREEGSLIGIKNDFEIITPEDSKVLLHRNLKVNARNCHRYITAINKLKDFMISPEKIEVYVKERIGDKTIEELFFQIENMHLSAHLKNSVKDESIEIGTIKKALELKKFVNTWNAYEKIKKYRNYLDYSDLNGLSLLLLNKNPSISKKYSYFIVDEFQDTSKHQLDFLLSIASSGNLTLVGDMNQSIYQFRGAYRKNLEILKNKFSLSEKMFKLDKSHRSKNKVLRAAHKLILNNYIKKEECFPVLNNDNVEGEKIKVYETLNAQQEARKVSEIIDDLQEKGIPLEEICVMYRTHEQGKLIKIALDSKSIKYNSLNRSSLLKKKPVREIINYLSILSTLKKNGHSSMRNWWELAHQREFPDADLIKIGNLLKENKDVENFSAKMLNTLDNLDLTPEGKIISKSLCDKIKLLLKETKNNLHEKIKLACEIVLSEKENLEIEDITNVGKFEEFSKSSSRKNQINDIENFLHYLESLESLEIKVESAGITKEGINLMTSHASKGLEYNTVIVTNLSEGRFPITRTINNSIVPSDLLPAEEESQITEERRLCYVAFTRAKENLILTYAKNYGKASEPSRFLQEINYRDNPDIEFIQDLEEKAFNIQIKSEPKIRENSEKRNYSPTAIITFDECQKKFEYRYVYNMPDRFDDLDSLKLGSFIHVVLEHGVKNNFSSIKEFVDYSEDLLLKDEWSSLDKNEILFMIRTFFERNKNKFDKNSLTEHFLSLNIEGINFIGIADRIDIKNGYGEIIDYKTGKSQITAKNRNFQLGYYVLAAERFCKVKKVTLEMLRQDKPLEFENDGNGNFKDINSPRTKFNISEIKSEIVEIVRKIQNAFKVGFSPCSLEKNCEFCNEHVYEI